MKYLVRAFVVFLLLLPFTVSAQTKYDSKFLNSHIQVLNDKVTVNKKGEATVKFTITPEKDWYIYSIHEKNGEPITIVSLNEDIVIGKLKEHPKPLKELDEGFEAEVYKHFLPVTITIPIKINKKAFVKNIRDIELIVVYQTVSSIKGQAIFEETPIKLVVKRK